MSNDDKITKILNMAEGEFSFKIQGKRYSGSINEQGKVDLDEGKDSQYAPDSKKSLIFLSKNIPTVASSAFEKNLNDLESFISVKNENNEIVKKSFAELNKEYDVVKEKDQSKSVEKAPSQSLFSRMVSYVKNIFGYKNKDSDVKIDDKPTPKTQVNADKELDSLSQASTISQSPRNSIDLEQNNQDFVGKSVEKLSPTPFKNSDILANFRNSDNSTPSASPRISGPEAAKSLAGANLENSRG